ncbi:MAG: OmpA family protein [Gammaproteobacteria bacterium]
MRIQFVFLTLVVSAAGCVASGTHEAVVQELDSTRQSLSSAQKETEKVREELKTRQEKLNRTTWALDRAEKDLLDLEIRKQDLQKELQESKLQLEVLREVEAETNRRNQIYNQFVEQLQVMIEEGQLTVGIEKGRVVIKLPDDVLFRSGRASLNAKGEQTLAQVAEVLAQFTDRRFQVEGYTDNKPISSARFPSNWELSAARALSVLHLLVEKGVDPEHVSAAGFGEYHARADNETPAGRELNRRIEIIMLPNLDVLSSELPTASR